MSQRCVNHSSSFLQLTKKHKEGRIEKVDWLDRLTFREIEQISERQKRVSRQMYLMIEFPEAFFQSTTKFDIVYFDMGGDHLVPYPSKTPATFHDSMLSMVSGARVAQTNYTIITYYSIRVANLSERSI